MGYPVIEGQQKYPNPIEKKYQQKPRKVEDEVQKSSNWFMVVVEEGENVDLGMIITNQVGIPSSCI